MAASSITLKQHLINIIALFLQMLNDFENSPECPQIWKPVIETAKGIISALEVLISSINK